jgi:hypothetical protein
MHPGRPMYFSLKPTFYKSNGSLELALFLYTLIFQQHGEFLRAKKLPCSMFIFIQNSFDLVSLVYTIGEKKVVIGE